MHSLFQEGRESVAQWDLAKKNQATHKDANCNMKSKQSPGRMLPRISFFLPFSSQPRLSLALHLFGRFILLGCTAFSNISQNLARIRMGQELPKNSLEFFFQTH